MDVCQKCGDTGHLKHLIYCVRCKVSVEHDYCLDVLPKRGEKVVWTCEVCSPNSAKLGLVPSRKSGRINQAAEVRLNRMKMRKQCSFHTSKAHNHRLSEVKPSTGDQSFLNKEVKNLPSYDQSLGNEFRKVKRRLVIEDGENSDEESEPIKVEASQLAPTVCDVHAQPIIDPIWRGCFNISNVKNRTSVRLLAHLSSRACSQARDSATSLPPLLNVVIMSRSDAWPQKFQKSPPTDDSIGLYFFPEHESDEKVFDTLLDDMIDQNLALKAVINNFELLVFSSRELPPEHWRFCRKYYLWGVFKTINHLVQTSRAECVTPSKLANNVGIQEQPTETGSSWSPCSPLSRSCFHVPEPRVSPSHPEALNFSSECVSFHILNHVRPDNTKERCDNELAPEIQNGQHANEDRRGASDVNFQPEETLCGSVNAKHCPKLFPLEVDTAGVAKEGRSTKLVVELESGFSVREDLRDGSTGYQRLPENYFASPSGKAIF